MKTTIKTLVVAGGLLILSSCGGWSAGQENAFKETCEKNGTFDCECCLKLVKEKYPNNSDYNAKAAQDMELAEKMLDCSK